jgi:AraC-like DNA-binding protein
MSRLSGLSERSFKRRFQRATGMPPLEYVHTLRLEESKHLLETTDAPIEAVANEVGYADASFFGRLFRRKVGMTPAQYRRRFGVAQIARNERRPLAARANGPLLFELLGKHAAEHRLEVAGFGNQRMEGWSADCPPPPAPARSGPMCRAARWIATSRSSCDEVEGAAAGHQQAVALEQPHGELVGALVGREPPWELLAPLDERRRVDDHRLEVAALVGERLHDVEGLALRTSRCSSPSAARRRAARSSARARHPRGRARAARRSATDPQAPV